MPINNNYFQQTINWKVPNGRRDEYPTARLDYQATSKWAYHVAWNLRHNRTDPTGPNYPDLPIQQGESKETHYALERGSVLGFC